MAATNQNVLEYSQEVDYVNKSNYFPPSLKINVLYRDEGSVKSRLIGHTCPYIYGTTVSVWNKVRIITLT